MAKRKRRSFTKEFRAEVVELCERGDRSNGQVVRDLDLTETAVRSWVKQAAVDRGDGPAGALTTDEREELRRLRRENRQLREDREILKKPRPSSRRRPSKQVLVHPRGEGQPLDQGDVQGADGLDLGLLRLARQGALRA